MSERTWHRHLPRRRLIAGWLGLVGAAGATAAFGATSCDALKQLAVEHTQVDAAELVTAGVYQPPGGAELTGLPAFCRIHGTVTPVADSRIGFELWLPAADWNGKLEMFGNGGYSSKIAYG